MMKNKKVLYAVVAVALIAAAVLYFKKQQQNKKVKSLLGIEPDPDENPEATTAVSQGSFIGSIDQSKILAQGSRGTEVRALQEALNSRGQDLNVDGIFGKDTLTALQYEYGVSEISLKDLYAFVNP